jgi:hypothetical protein
LFFALQSFARVFEEEQNQKPSGTQAKEDPKRPTGGVYNSIVPAFAIMSNGALMAKETD